MADPRFVSRQKSEADDLDFEALRAAGVDLVQKLSGEHWTDFNIHDPGVTILEALCYGLSDMAYRADFAVPDYLAGANDSIDFEGLALFRPDEMLPCDPVTIEDLRKAIHGEIPEIRNVWLERCETGDLAPALLSAYVQLQPDENVQAPGRMQREVERRLREVVACNRALGEDVEDVEFVEEVYFGLSGEIEVAAGNDALSLVAEVCWCAQHYLNPRPGWRSYQDAFAQQQDLEVLLRGPLTRMGVMASRELAPWRDQFLASELIGMVAGLPGVERVNRLSFVDSAGEELQSIDLHDRAVRRSVAMLDLKEGGGDNGITVLSAGRRERFAASEVERELARLTIQRNEFRSRPAQFDWIRTLLPQGKRRHFSSYHSIQHHFPDIYGLNAFGVPSSASELRHAQAMQLKGYLLLHEQFMANFLSQIEKIPDLFSIFPKGMGSYSSAALGNNVVPRVEELYVRGLDGRAESLGRILDEFDDSVERRHRLLNRLLAMHGHDDTRQLVDAIAQARRLNGRDALAGKQWLLSSIRDFGKGRMRGGGFGGDEDDWHGHSGLERNLSILFGTRMEPASDDGGDVPGPEYLSPIRVIDHLTLRSALVAGLTMPGGKPYVADFFLFRVSIVVSEDLKRVLSDDHDILLNRAIAICCPAHIAAQAVVLDKRRFGDFLACRGSWQSALMANDEARLASEAAALLAFLAE